MTIAQTIAVSLALAFVVEGGVEYFFGSIANHVPALEPWKWTLMYVAAAVGVGLAFYYRLDLIALVGGQGETEAGFALTGIVIGRGANYLHQFVTAYLPKFGG